MQMADFGPQGMSTLRPAVGIEGYRSYNCLRSPRVFSQYPNNL